MPQESADGSALLIGFTREDRAALNWSFGLYEKLQAIILSPSMDDAASKTCTDLNDAIDASSVTIAMKDDEGFRVVACYIPLFGFNDPLTGKDVGTRTPPDSIAEAVSAARTPIIWRSKTGKPVSGWFIFPCFFGVPIFDDDDEIVGTVVIGYDDTTKQIDSSIIASAEVFAGAFSVALYRMREITELSAEVKRQSRQRILQEVHDSAIQNLFSAELCIQRVVEQRDVSVEISEMLHEAQTSVSEAKSDLRRIILTMKDESSTRDLASIVEDEVQNHLTKHGAPVETRLQVLREPPQHENEAIRMIVHESLANVRKHSRASAVMIFITADDRTTLIGIQDNGVGFDRLDSPGDNSGLHFGLGNIKQIASDMGGSAEFDNDSDTGGATVFVRIPIEWRGLE